MKAFPRLLVRPALFLAGSVLLVACSRGGGNGELGVGEMDLAAADDADLAGADLRGAPDAAAPDAGPPTGDPVLAKAFGGSDSDYAHGMATDASGNIVLTGEFSGTVNLGGGALLSAGLSDAFIAKYGPGGAHLWSKRYGSNLQDSGRRIAVDGAGNVFVAGVFRGAVDFGGGPITSAGSQDLFLVKLDPDGKHLWSKRYGSGGDESPGGLAVAGSDVVLVGGFFGAVDFGGGALTSTSGSEDIFVVRYGPDGAHRWSRRYGGGSRDEVNAVAVDPMGNTLAIGAFQGTVDFGAGPVSSYSGGYDVFLLKLTTDGMPSWSKRFGSFQTDRGQDVATDGAGNVLITGTFSDQADFGAGPLTSAGMADVFIGKYTAAGAHSFAIRVGGTRDDYGLGIAVDPWNNVIAAGSFSGTADFGGGPRASNGGSQDIYLAKYGPAGTHIWSRPIGGPSEELLGDLAVDPGGGIVCAGSFSGTADFGGGPLTAMGSHDILLLKRAP